MAVLPDADRVAVWAELMQKTSQDREAVPITKTELRAAIDAIDAWINSAATSFNSAIPLPARTALTARQKARLLVFVVERRWKVS